VNVVGSLSQRGDSEAIAARESVSPSDEAVFKVAQYYLEQCRDNCFVFNNGRGHANPLTSITLSGSIAVIAQSPCRFYHRESTPKQHLRVEYQKRVTDATGYLLSVVAIGKCPH
jgi:hypothetical protein